MVFFGGAGSAGGWSGGGPGMGGNLRPNSLKRSTDGWDDDELGSVYSHKVVVRMAKMIAPYRFRLFLAILGVLGFATLTRAMPLAVRGLITAATHGDLTDLNRWGWAYIAMAVFSAGFFYVQMTSTGWIGHRLLLRLRKDMFAHLQKLSLRFYDNNEVGRVMSRITSDVTSLQELMTGGLLTIIGDVVGIAISAAFLLYFDVQLTLVTFTVVPVLVLTMAVWQAYSRRAFVRVRQAIAVVNANLQENVSGVRVIQSLSREDENAKRFDSVESTTAANRKNAFFQSQLGSTTIASDTEVAAQWKNIRVIGGHGLTERGTAPADGFYASIEGAALWDLALAEEEGAPVRRRRRPESARRRRTAAADQTPRRSPGWPARPAAHEGPCRPRRRTCARRCRSRTARPDPPPSPGPRRTPRTPRAVRPSPSAARSTTDAR